MATRGSLASDLQAESLWIQGPEFLLTELSEWPIDDVTTSSCPAAEKELKKKVLRVQTPVKLVLIDPATYSCWTKLLRVTA